MSEIFCRDTKKMGILNEQRKNCVSMPNCKLWYRLYYQDEVDSEIQ